MSYRRLAWGTIGYEEFFKSVAGLEKSNNDVLDVDESELPFDRKGSIVPHKLLKLISDHADTINLSSQTDLRKLGVVHTGVIAAREIQFPSDGKIVIGSRDLLILAKDINIVGLGEKAAYITAYDDKEVPPVATSGSGRGADGDSAGNITLVLLGDSIVSGNQKFFVDLRGQRGGVGPAGIQPAPRDARTARAARKPRWAYRKPTNKDVEKNRKYRDRVKREIQSNWPDRVDLQDLLKCLDGKDDKCKLPICEEDDWKEDADGKKGEKGYPANRGGRGGNSGKSGQLKIYYLGDDGFRTKLLETVFWADNGRKIELTLEQPTRDGGEGGEPSEPGEGGPGDQGLAGDPYGVCGEGKVGDSGDKGDKAQKGEHGDESEAGAPARMIQIDGRILP